MDLDCVPVLHQSHLALSVVAPAVLALVMQMVREQQSAASTSGRRVAAESNRGVISAAAGRAEEGTVLTASTAATGQTQRRAAASAGLAARGQVEGPVTTILSIIMTNAHWPPKRPN